MSDDWIDKNEMNQLISGINPKPPQNQRSVSGPIYNDLFHDIQPQRPQQQPAVQQPIPAQQVFPQQIPAQQAQPYPQPLHTNPHLHQQQQMQVQHPQAYHAQVPQPSPFTFDEEPTDPEERIAQLEMMLAELKQTQAPQPEGEPAQTIITPEEPVEEPQKIETPCNDRIPLSVEIDRYLSLKGRLNSLAEILQDHLQMEQMMVVDQNGLTLFETQSTSNIEGKADRYLQKMRSVYAVDRDNHRNHSASQLATNDGQWLLLVPTDGKGIERKYTLKCLLPCPLDPPEIYTLIELLNDTMRPAKS